MPGANLSTTQQIILIAALVILGVVLLQNGSDRPILSTWSGGGGTIRPSKSVGIAGSTNLSGRGLPGDPDAPYGNPLNTDRTILTQGYGVGSHAPADVWGGIDLAIDSDGDGTADPKGTWNAPVFATHDGIAHVKPETWPAGNYLAIEGTGYKTAFAHLAQYAVGDGESVKRGQLIGYVGSTGQASGPHLHYEVWKAGQNVNPLDYGVLAQP